MSKKRFCTKTKISICTIAVTITIIVVITLTILRNNQTSESEVIVNTEAGYVRGRKIPNDIIDFYAFFKIPYAQPPVGNLRFKAPQPIEPWEGIYDSRNEGPMCYQDMSDEDNKSEDCLNLHVYTKEFTSEELKPVFVHIHSGALEAGAPLYEVFGPHYLIQKDIVIVTPQFRLGIFGFLNLNLEGAPGNMGLLDVMMSLRWVKNNIQKFGGDPNRITLGGVSSGAIIAHVLTMSPAAQGLFRSVIFQSGTALSYRFYNRNLELSIQQTKEQVNRSNSTNEVLLDHLLSLESSEISDIQRNIKNLYPGGYAQYYPYVLTQDYHGTLTMHPIDLITQNNYLNIPMLAGFISEEGTRMYSDMDQDFVNEHFYVTVPTDLYDINDRSLEKNITAQRIKEFYFGDEELSIETFDKYIELCTDSWYGHITDYMVRLQSNGSYTAPIYYYMFAVDGAYNSQKLVHNVTQPGPTHGDCEGYLWKKASLDDVIPTDDYSELTRQRMVTMWTNFIKYSDPVPETTNLLPVKWEAVDYPLMNNLLINATLSIQQEPFRDRLLFWQRLYTNNTI